MAVYVDTARYPFGRMIMCHMSADSLEELHDMARRIGVSRRWFQCPPKASHPHYDICKSKRRSAVEQGAIEIADRDLLPIARRLTAEWAADQR